MDCGGQPHLRSRFPARIRCAACARRRLPISISCRVGLSTIGSSNVRIGQYIDNGSIEFQIRGLAPNNTNLNTSNTLTQVVQSSGLNTAGPLYKLIGSTDKSFYDFEEINLAASGYATGKATIANATLDQGLIETRRNRTDVQLAWRREDQEDYRRQHIGQLDGVGTTVLIDATERHLDGSPNPFVGRPYIGGVQPQAFRRPVFNDNYRGQIAHQLDLRKEPSLLKWVGLHRAIGYGEHVTNFETGSGYRYRDFVTNVGPLNPATTAGASRVRNESSTFTRYYMGDAIGGNIDYANSGAAKTQGPFPVRYLETTTAPGSGGDPTRWTTLDSTVEERYFALSAQKRKTNTRGFTLQSYLLNDHIVTTWGRREDRIYTSQQLPIPNLADGFPDESFLDDQSHFGRDKKWRDGMTETRGIVAKPFRSWNYVQSEGRTGLNKVLAEAVRGLSFHYNESSSFRPADVAYNIYLGELANPQAQTEEYGFSLSLMDNRFFMRLTHQETLQIDKRGGTGVIGTRAVSIDFDIPGQTRNFDLFQRRHELGAAGKSKPYAGAGSGGGGGEDRDHAGAHCELRREIHQRLEQLAVARLGVGNAVQSHPQPDHESHRQSAGGDRLRRFGAHPALYRRAAPDLDDDSES